MTTATDAEKMRAWILSMQSYPLAGPVSERTKLEAARELYITGRISIGEFEARLDALLRG